MTGIGEAPLEYLDAELRSWLDGYEQVPGVTLKSRSTKRSDASSSEAWVHRGGDHRSSHAAARVRARTGIPGLSERESLSAEQINEAVPPTREIPCARCVEIESGDDLRAFARQEGFPIILKPRDGAGAQGTSRVNSAQELEALIQEEGLDQRPVPLMAEEFIEGHEGFYDTITAGGHTLFEGVCHYYPGVLEAMRTRWISPQIMVTNRLDSAGYDGQDHGLRCPWLGLSRTPTHMEWFFGPKGSSSVRSGRALRLHPLGSVL